MAVFTEPDVDEISRALEAFQISPLTSIIGLSEGIENTTYVLYGQDEKHILTMFERRVAVPDVAFFDALMRSQRASGVRCPVLVGAPDGRRHFFNNDRLCVIQTAISGLVHIHPTPGNCFDAGAVLGKMHITAEALSLERPNPVGVFSWPKLYKRLAPNLGENWSSRKRALLASLDAVTSNWPAALPRGAIHADYFLENVLFEPRGRVGVIDFFLGCSDLFAYDLGLAVTSWGFDAAGDMNAERLRAFMQGYASQRALEAEEKAALPLLIEAGALRILLTRLTDEWQRRHPNIETIRQSEEYWRKLVTIVEARRMNAFAPVIS